MTLRIPCIALAIAIVLGPRYCAADVIIDWNNELLETIRSGSVPPPPATRVMAMINTAMYDAVNSVAGTHVPYHFVPATAPDPLTSKEAAATQAAYRVMATAFPANQSVYDAALAESLSRIADGPDKTAGIELGDAAGAAILSLRADDGARSPIEYTPSSDPGRWRPTPPGFADAAVPHWANVTPWTMTSNSQFRNPIGPPPLDTVEYADAYDEVKEIGSVSSTTRTEDQSNIAKFWAGRTGTSTPAGQWNRIAQTVAESEGNSLEENARLFAFVGLTQADAVISSWDNKYHFDYWRPVTAIREADTDGNPATVKDPDWLPLIDTPNFPTYTAAHGTASGATSKVLELFFGRDDITFTSSTEGFDDVPDRTFTSFSQAGMEGATSRLYAGIHWSFDNEDAFRHGRDLAIYMNDNFLRPIPEPSSAALACIGLVLLLASRRKSRSSSPITRACPLPFGGTVQGSRRM